MTRRRSRLSNTRQRAPQLARVERGKLTIRLHPGQQRAHDSNARFVVVTAGTQSGKTSYGPHWMLREIKRCGPGDYLIVTPTFQLLERKLLSEFRRLFEKQLKLGRYYASPTRIFVFSAEGERRIHGQFADADMQTRVQFGYAADPDSLESMTCQAAWCDEAGQKKFKLDAWHAVLRRLSLAQGRVLITTSVYALHWLKSLVNKAAQDRSIEVFRFDSTENPGFPKAEFERARRDLPKWKFDMLYRGMFTKPAGLIYDCVDDTFHKIPRFSIPRDWSRYVGLDFGTRNMAASFWAEEPGTKKLFCYRTYHHAGEDAAGHVRRLKHGEPGLPSRIVGGAQSENEWRGDFRSAGYPVRAPGIQDVEVGITRVYGAWQRGELYAFDDLEEFWDELTTYSRALDDSNEPTDEIEDKSEFHLLDTMRYIISDVKAAGQKMRSGARSHYGKRDLQPRAARERTDEEIEIMLERA